MQYLRALSVVLIVMAHKMMEHLPFWRYADVGVDIFFIGSGFLMFALTEAKPVSPGRFLIDRVTRIVPLYWLATLISAAIVLGGHTVWGATGDFGHILLSMLFIPVHNGTFGVFPVVPQGWTLNYEMLFYLLFGLILFLPKSSRLAALSSMLIGLVGLGYLLEPTHPIAVTYTHPRFLDFIIGGILAHLFGMSLERTRMFVALAGSALLSAVMFWLGGIEAKLSYAGWATLLFAGVLLVERINWMPRLPAAKLLGDASYAIYVFQELAFKLVHVGMRHFRELTGIRFGTSLPEQLLCVIAAIALGVLIYIMIEKPMIRFTRQIFLPGRRTLSERLT